MFEGLFSGHSRVLVHLEQSLHEILGVGRDPLPTLGPHVIATVLDQQNRLLLGAGVEGRVAGKQHEHDHA